MSINIREAKYPVVSLLQVKRLPQRVWHKSLMSLWERERERERERRICSMHPSLLASAALKENRDVLVIWYIHSIHAVRACRELQEPLMRSAHLRRLINKCVSQSFILLQSYSHNYSFQPKLVLSWTIRSPCTNGSVFKSVFCYSTIVQPTVLYKSWYQCVSQFIICMFLMTKGNMRFNKLAGNSIAGCWARKEKILISQSIALFVYYYMQHNWNGIYSHIYIYLFKRL